VSRYDWLLFLHVLAAFLWVGAAVVYSAVLAAAWRIERPSTIALLFRLTVPADAAIPAGAVGTIAFGIWLAVDVEGYSLGDGWIVAALVLWLVCGALGARTGAEYAKARDLARRLVTEGRDEPSAELGALLRSPRALALHVLSTAAVLVILVLMIFKPGA
jgi:uncharacterized membrane protein